MNESRPLMVKADTTEIASNNRIRVRGKASMTLLPDIYTVDLYNLSDEDIATLCDSKQLYVFSGAYAMLCCGEIEDVYVHQADANMIHTIVIVDGKTFHNTKVSTTLSGGSSVRGAMNTLMNGNIGAYLAKDMRFPRGQTFSGWLPDYISVLAKSVNARAFFSQGSLYVTEKGKARNLLAIDEEDLTGDVDEAEGVLILKTLVKGYPVGTIIQFRQRDYRLAAQAYDADNSTGFWRSVLTLADESMLSAYGMEGG